MLGWPRPPCVLFFFWQSECEEEEEEEEEEEKDLFIFRYYRGTQGAEF
jgi:hypothetical protein